jgi:hypothetical protein
MSRQLPLSADIPLPVQRALRTLTGWAGEDETNAAQVTQSLSAIPAMQQSLSDLSSQMANRGQTVTVTFSGGFTISGKTYHNLYYVSGQLLRYD